MTRRLFPFPATSSLQVASIQRTALIQYSSKAFISTTPTIFTCKGIAPKTLCHLDLINVLLYTGLGFLALICSALTAIVWRFVKRIIHCLSTSFAMKIAAELYD